MHSAWNSCPQGKLITLLSPSTYSSRQTTHSTCLPVYLRRQRLDPELDFSPDGASLAASAALETIPDVVWERGLDCADGEREPETRRGEVGVEAPGLADDWDVDEEAGMV